MSIHDITPRLAVFVRLLGVSLLLVLFTGCSSSSSNVKVVDKTRTYKNKPVVQRVGGNPSSGEYTKVTTGQHVVQKGETLYSIAFRYGWDLNSLAQRNNIAAPYTIYPGQIISLSATTKPTATVAKTSTGATNKTAAQTTTKASTKSTATATTTGTASKAQAVSGGWQWPANGMLISGFSPSGSLNKGVDIAGKEGDPILAASAGTVVYAGNNLRGYGELLIIKHNDSYVSAYAHNSKLLVKEGQKVTAGQRIANMGSTGTDRVKLHFEIRLNGKPVDPTKYLPKR